MGTINPLLGLPGATPSKYCACNNVKLYLNSLCDSRASYIFLAHRSFLKGTGNHRHIAPNGSIRGLGSGKNEKVMDGQRVQTSSYGR